jgi:predicted RNA-binding Zn-ribbon protein involved in translation (DUF1610 family)
MTIFNSGGNYSKIVDLQRDDDGNILQCPKCSSTYLVKRGKVRSTQSLPQRYQCRDCGFRTVHPKKSMNNKNYKVENTFKEDEISTEDLVKLRLDNFERKEKREKNEEFLNVTIRDEKPIGLYIMGDPHIDDDGCDIPAVIKHLDITNKTDGMFACNVGDLQNNWARRTKLAGLWAEQSTTAEQSWQLTEWLIKYTDWIFIVAGNHDVWSGDGDPVKWICKPLKTTYAQHNIRVKIKLPKHNVRVNCSHNFRGNSIYNTAHGIVRHAIFNSRDHLLMAGHTHVSGYMPVKDTNSDITMHCVQVGSYKKYDNFAKMLNLPNKMMSPCAVAVFNTFLPETHPDFIKIFWEVQEGADYLTFLRKKK